MVSGTRHGEALRRSSQIARHLLQMYRPGSPMISPEDVISVLSEAGVRFVLMGNYGITGWRLERRASEDVDVLVRTRDHRKAVDVIRKAFPDLQMKDSPVVTRFIEPATEIALIDLMKPNQPLFKDAFKQTVLVEEGYRIPNLELALASKFAAMVSPNRADEKKFLDAADFTSIVKKNRSAIHPRRLRRLGELVYPGGGAEITELVENIKAGRRIEF